MDIVFDNKIYKYQYLFSFIVRSFLIALICFMCFITLLFTVYFIDVTINSKKPLFGAYIIASPSMVPTIKINDAIIVKRVDHDQYNIGDIITFESTYSQYKGLMVTHRIVDKMTKNNGRSKYTTKGDNNYIVDPTPVMTEDIYGRVLFRIPGLGNLQSFFSKPSNYFLCLIIPGTLFVLYEVTRIVIMLFKHQKEFL